MTRQKSDEGIVPPGRVTSPLTADVEQLRGGRALAVNEEPRQHELAFTTAENPKGATGRAERVATRQAESVAPKVQVKTSRSTAATMECVVERLAVALRNVAANKGAPGPDRQTIAEVREHWSEIQPRLEADLQKGEYRPGNIRRVWLPKPGGGERGLGIPNVIDRVVQEAVRQTLDPLYEPSFHPNSHGFRPGRSCHTATVQAKEYVAEGYEVVVDIDLEKFFDQVCHQRLIASLERRIEDRRLLVLIRQMLRAGVVMPDGVVVSATEGVPQGGPLSPLLSNIVLDELDRELERRGHRFVRYADDCNIYVRSERAGQRVMESVSKFIKDRLRLKVNAKKSAVARTGKRHFLGFSLKVEPTSGEVEVMLSDRTRKRIAGRVRELTPRNWGQSLTTCIANLNRYLRGWFGFFGICSVKEERFLGNTDAHIRRRLRAIQLKQWKRKRTMARRLIQLGARPQTAWRSIYGGRKSLWALSILSVANATMNIAYFTKKLGLLALKQLQVEELAKVAAQVRHRQLCLPLG